MQAQQPADYLWENICSLLGLTDPSIREVSRRLGVSHGTAQRIKERNGHRATDVLAEISTALGIEVWQLLVPRLQQGDRPTLGSHIDRRDDGEAFLVEAYRAADDESKRRMVAVIAAGFPAATRQPIPPGAQPTPAPQPDQTTPPARRRGALLP